MQVSLYNLAPMPSKNMNVNIIAVGSLKEKFFIDAAAEYVKRLTRFCSLKIIEIGERNDLEREAADILSKLDKNGAGRERSVRPPQYVIVLDVGGSPLTSEKFAQKIDGLKTNGVSEVTFIIGSSEGLSESVKKRADMLLSFGEFTYPHRLVRVMLLEQIYRAFTINAGMPYHK